MMLLCNVGLNWPSGSGEENFLILVNVFLLFQYYLPFKESKALHLNILNPLHPMMLCARFGWNWPSGSGEEVENVDSLKTDDRQLGNLIWVVRSGELKTCTVYCIILLFKKNPTKTNHCYGHVNKMLHEIWLLLSSSF